MVSMLLIHLVHKCIHYMAAYLRIPPNKNNVLLPLFNYVTTKISLEQFQIFMLFPYV